MNRRGYRVGAVLFDFDGTLSRPGALDFAAIREALGCPDGVAVLEYIQSIADPERQRTVKARLEAFEVEGARASRINAGATESISALKALGIPLGILTRNSRASVMRAFRNFETLRPGDFDLIITRDDPLPPKPSGDGVVRAAERFGLPVEEILVVGDYIFDTQAGRAAGALTALLDPDGRPVLAATPCDFRIRRLADVLTIVGNGRPLPAGKLSNKLLETILEGRPREDPALLMPPGVGEDAAAVRMSGEEVLVLKSDPITFATDAIGRYAVVVNANDIVTSGAIPRWMLATLLLPVGTTPSQVSALMDELFDVCRQLEITLCGGHTEITPAVRQPVVAAMLAGTVSRDGLIDKRRLRTGDRVILTKGIAVEGTAILAREFGDRLRERGLSAGELAAGEAMLEQISVRPEAVLAARGGWAVAMHDVTEGGLATALEELSIAGGHRLRVSMDSIPCLDLTRKFCEALDLDPLGLIGSGALLICCRPEGRTPLLAALQAGTIPAVEIGEVLENGRGVEARIQGRPVAWPRFEVDEIARLYGG